MIGLDLRTMRVVHPEDEDGRVWLGKGYRGDRTLVCLHCYLGGDVARGTQVALVCAGSPEGKVRPHFRHPPRLGPRGGHQPQDRWRDSAVQVMAAILQARPEVERVRVEDERGIVEFVDGGRLVLEARDEVGDFVDRHLAYAAEGAVDVWLWRRRVPEAAIGDRQCHWLLSDDLARVGVPIAAGHDRTLWTEDAAAPVDAEHYPPCPGDRVRFVWVPLRDVAVSAQGLAFPADVVRPPVRRSVRTRRLVVKPRAAGPIPGALHIMHRIDAHTPDAEPALRRYRCQDGCEYLGADSVNDGVHMLVDETVPPLPPGDYGVF
jgi:hypothetical protein